MNKHIIVGANYRCLCGIFEGKPLGCADIIKAVEVCKTHGQSWDGGLLARLFETLIVDVDITTPTNQLSESPELNECLKALHCLYIAVDESVAKSVNDKVRAYIDQLQSQLAKLKQEKDELKKQIPCPVRAHFCACPNCEPVMCCNSQECGCQGLPVDFKITDKCDNYCLNKVHQEWNTTKRQLTATRQGIADLIAVFQKRAEGWAKQGTEKGNLVSNEYLGIISDIQHSFDLSGTSDVRQELATALNKPSPSATR